MSSAPEPMITPAPISSNPTRKSPRTRISNLTPSTQYKVPETYSIPGRGTISIPGSNKIKIGKPKKGSFGYNASSNAAPIEIIADDTSASVIHPSLSPMPTTTTVAPHIDEIVLIPTRITTASGGITKPKKTRKNNPLVVELRPRVKQYTENNDMTDELDWETSKLIAAVEGYRERGQEVGAQAKKWYALTKNKKTQGLSRKTLDILERDKFDMRQWEFKHVHHRSKKS
jgi:hypothetical protein